MKRSRHTGTNALQPKTRANVDLPTHLWERFEEVAKANYRSRSDHLRFLIAESVRQYDEANQGVGRAS